MTTLIFASNNQNKVDEIKLLIGDQFNILSLKDGGIDVDIPEPHNTLEANAKEKSLTIYNLTKQNCFSEDTGLEVEALNGEPGVMSARYAGDNKSNEHNIDKLITKLQDKPNRKAQFRTVVSLIIDGNEHQFEGVCTGTITSEKIGGNGFGYDAVFIPDGTSKTFAEMELTEKNKFSHRQKAIAQLLAFLSHVGKKLSS